MLALFAAVLLAQNATTPGLVTSPSPTTQSLSLEWAISGDDNLDGRVTVRYRAQGTQPWLAAMPLVRIPAGRNTTGTFGSGGGQWGNKHAGSLMDLSPGTTWEVELTLVDPDGGGTTRTVTASTRPIPVEGVGAVHHAVTVATFAAALGAVQPGDVLVLANGAYPAFTLSTSGQPGRPIILRGESVDGVTFSGKLTLTDLAHVWLENVTVLGEVRLNGSSNMVVRGCKVHTPGEGISFQRGAAVPHDNYIVDNDVVGAANWVDSQLSVSGYNGGEGIEFTGSGHVVCFNHVKGFRDDISLMEYDEAFEQTSIDICNNDIEEATDDAVEADSAMGNVRVVRNRVKNCFDGLSSQPDLGGPTYYLRNTLFNVLYTPFKFHNGTVGDQVFHNTVLKNGDAFGCYAGATWSRAVFRNNLFLGGPGGTWGGYANGTGRVLDLADADATCSFDYDGLGSTTGTFEGKVGATRFTSLATLRAMTSEGHAQEVDLSVFAHAVPFPSAAFPPKADVDLSLAPGSLAVDHGVVLAGLDEDFSGLAPDLGALELGAAPPVVGPRVGVTGTGGGGAATGGGGGGGGAGADAGSGLDAGLAPTAAVGSCGCSASGAPVLLVALLVRRAWRRHAHGPNEPKRESGSTR